MTFAALRLPAGKFKPIFSSLSRKDRSVISSLPWVVSYKTSRSQESFKRIYSELD